MTAATANQEATASNERTVSVGIDELIIGRPIEFPIHDEKGLLLLAEGAVITSDFKRLLRQRGLQEVQIDARDAERITVNEELAAAAQAFSFDTELTKHLDQIIDGGMVPVQNRVPAVKDKIQRHGCKTYDNQQRERLAEENDQNQKMLAGMMKEALHGGAVDGQLAGAMTGNYLSEMQLDIDNVLNSTGGVFGDSSIAAQSLQTSLLSMAIGIEMGLDADNIRMLGLVGLVHDWGMARVPEHVRVAPHPLSSNDFHEIRKHPIHSLEMLQKASGMPGLVSLVAYQIHERPNGTGYPRGRSGNAIHQFARIVAVADSYTAMTTPKPYRPAFMAYAAIECLLRDAQKRNLEARVVRHLLTILSLFPIGSLVTLSDGSIGRVLRRNGDKYMSPIVQRLQNGRGERVDSNTVENLIDLGTSELKVEQALPTPGRNEVGLTTALNFRDKEICSEG